MRIAARSGRLLLDLTGAERTLLTQLATELVTLLEQDAAREVATRDPAVARLLPDAYTDDTDASAEYRRLTEGDLVALKTENATMVAEAAVAGSRVVLDAQQAVPWLRAITDIRLALATRLGIEHDDDEGDLSPEAAPTRAAYWWLGELQERMLEALGSL